MYICSTCTYSLDCIKNTALYNLRRTYSDNVNVNVNRNMEIWDRDPYIFPFNLESQKLEVVKGSLRKSVNFLPIVANIADQTLLSFYQ
jgi:hypothetical protein